MGIKERCIKIFHDRDARAITEDDFNSQLSNVESETKQLDIFSVINVGKQEARGLRIAAICAGG